MGKHLMTMGSRRIKVTSEACYKYAAVRSVAVNDEDGVRK